MNFAPDELYRLLPAIHQIRDGAEGEAFKAFLKVVEEQAHLLHKDVEGLYANWFIETCDDWVVPYLADLVGYRRNSNPGMPGDSFDPHGKLLNQFLYPRTDIAGTVRNRRRKGTLPVLEDLAWTAAGWHARAVEFADHVVALQHNQAPRPEIGRTLCIRDRGALQRLGGPFERTSTARLLDTRTMQPRPGVGWAHPANVALFVWRRPVVSVSACRPRCHTDPGGTLRYFTFDRLGVKRPLAVKVVDETTPTGIADEPNVPQPLYRFLLAKEGDPRSRASEIFYGVGRSVVILECASTSDGSDKLLPVPAERIRVCNLCDARCRLRAFHALRNDEMALDPECGIFMVKTPYQSEDNYRVTWHHAIPHPMGGGEYEERSVERRSWPTYWPEPAPACGEPSEIFADSDLRIWLRRPQPMLPGARARFTTTSSLTVELSTSDVFRLSQSALDIEISDGHTLEFRAQNLRRPVLELPLPADPCQAGLRVRLGRDSRLILDGLVMTGSIRLEPLEPLPAPPSKDPFAEPETDQTPKGNPPVIVLRHSTLIPRGAGCDGGCGGAALTVELPEGWICIEKSIVGPIEVLSEPVRPRGVPQDCPRPRASIRISDSILDSFCHCTKDGGPRPVLYGDLPRIAAAPHLPGLAYVNLTVERCTLRGSVSVEALTAAEDSLFLGVLAVQRRQEGWLRFCYLNPECQGDLRTPVRFKCLPESAGQDSSTNCRPAARDSSVRATGPARVRPAFVSTRYGHPGYCQLTLDVSSELQRGASDESEIGAYHDAYFPQRDAALRARLDEFTPADMRSALLYADDLHPCHAVQRVCCSAATGQPLHGCCED